MFVFWFVCFFFFFVVHSFLPPNMQQQAESLKILSNLDKKETSWFVQVCRNNEKPESDTRSAYSVDQLHGNLVTFGLQEIPLQVDERDSLFSCFAFWEHRYSLKMGPQFISADDERSDFNVSQERLKEVREALGCTGTSFGGIEALMKWAKDNNFRVFVIFPFLIQRLPEEKGTQNATKNIVMISCCDRFFFRPLVFRCPSKLNPSNLTDQLTVV